MDFWSRVAMVTACLALGAGAARADMASGYAGTVTSSLRVDNAANATGMADSVCATTVTPEPTSIVLTNFGFMLPAGATVHGVQVDAKVGYPTGAGFGSFSVSLTTNAGGSYLPTSIALPGDGEVADCAATTFKSAGGPTELWGSSFGATSINSANFGVRLLGFADRFIDAVRVTVYFTPPGTPTATGTATGAATSTGTATATATATATTTATPTATGTATATTTATATGTPTATPMAPQFTAGVAPGATRVFGQGEPNLPAGTLRICLAGANRVFEDCGGDDVLIGSGQTDAAGVFSSSPGIPVAPPLQAGDVVCAYDAVNALSSCALVAGPAPAPALGRAALLAALVLLAVVALRRLRPIAGR